MGAQQSSGARPDVRAGGQCPTAPDARSTSACPMPDNVKTAAIYNVYNQRIDQSKTDPEQRRTTILDPRNNMPISANQQPYPGQRVLLPIDRVKSTIPKGGTDSTWEYPSPQMFYNALKRKGKDDGVPGSQLGDDSDLRGVMESVVMTHNFLNEMTWRAIQKWENLHPEKCDDIKLNRFIGRPSDTSPLAWIHQMMGGPAPFDRHDWYVLRDGKEVRYVIDFYFDESKAGSPEAFTVSERPALDNLGNGLDRVRMAVYSMCAQWGMPCPVTGHHSGWMIMVDAVESASFYGYETRG